MVLPVPRRFDQLLHDMVGRWLVGVSHSEVNDVFASLTGFHLQRLDLREDVRREPAYAIKLVHLNLISCQGLYQDVKDSLRFALTACAGRRVFAQPKWMCGVTTCMAGKTRKPQRQGLVAAEHLADAAVSDSSLAAAALTQTSLVTTPLR